MTAGPPDSREFGKHFAFAPLRPKREQREFFRLGVRVQIRVGFQHLTQRVIKLGAAELVEVRQSQIVAAHPAFSENPTQLGAVKRGIAQHARVNAGALRLPGPAQR